MIHQDDNQVLHSNGKEKKNGDFYFRNVDKNGAKEKYSREKNHRNMDIFTVTEMSNDNGSLPAST